jgi:hypothetical protein
MRNNRHTSLRALLTAAILLAPLSSLLLPAAPAHAQGSPAASREQVAKEKLAWLGQQLELSDGQKKKIRPMLQEMGNQLLAVKGAPDLSPEQRKSKSLVIVQNTFGTIRNKVLNSKQKTKFDEIKQQAIERMLASKAAAQGQPASGAPPH